MILTISILMLLFETQESSTSWSKLKLPASHIPYFFRNNPQIENQCLTDDSCPYKDFVNVRKCWGYEENCPTEERVMVATCPGDSRGWAKDKTTQVDKFWSDADFGYVKYFQKTQKIFCKPMDLSGAKLECSSFLRHCHATNIFIDFTNVNIQQSRDRYREDLFNLGNVGGYCHVDREALKKEDGHKSPLQSWYAELGDYTSLTADPFTSGNCDIIIEKPTYIIKLDAGINMFHHFCDFVNLYATFHLNNTFDTDINIIMWDTSSFHYGDYFEETWKAFTDHPIIRLQDFEGKKVCFRDAVFSLLARMRLGLYYNMPLVPGCHGSGLIKAFSEHVLYRLGITQDGPLKDKVRITLLDRQSSYRNIKNQEQLVEAMSREPNIDVKIVVYNRELPFLEQLQISHNSDIFIGMHGAGLTHMLFQPDWAAGFELYNCEDEHCYHDLARLRGIKYLTWEKPDKVFPEDEGHHPTLGAHAKFTNYDFDVDEFMRLTRKAVNFVQNHSQFRNARREKYGESLKTEL